MVVYKRRSTQTEQHRLLQEIHEEMKQLRAATQLYAARVERLLALFEPECLPHKWVPETPTQSMRKSGADGLGSK
jgi:hypothetical protein